MKRFYEKVDMRSREAMIQYLENHFRYSSMNSWNRSTSYANCVKIHRLDLTAVQMEQAWGMLECEDVSDAIQNLIRKWSMEREWCWQVGFNGRSSGYLVLYQGGLDYKNAHTARCDMCGKQTWHKQDVPCTTDWCDGTLRVLPKPIPQIVTYPGRGLDENEEFVEWDMEKLRDRVKLVQEFDRLCGDIVTMFAGFCDHYKVVDEQIMVPKTAKVLQPA
ncbi:hypothetical protein PDESU_02222 [Pontiella desulfatans]|uniref:Uncharacterized protein n=1 Tax=Pontiella desulfatans TaxID=2750659 RepID=A0A6C2U1A4_PONDE|nr:hypothetical protein [Pontiella desulfatans]VGO13665.1 hypothetical protein PDESU_02222 [Pontiella desulfatans]